MSVSFPCDVYTVAMIVYMIQFIRISIVSKTSSVDVYGMSVRFSQGDYTRS